MSLRRVVLVCVLASVAACSHNPERPAMTSPTGPTVAGGAGVLNAVPGSLLTAPVPAAGKLDALFPSRAFSFDFYGRLVGVYRDVLGRSGTPWFVDPEGQVVWVQEFTRYIANGCDVATATARVFAQIDGQPAGPLCAPPPSNAVVAFPPRDQVIAFILLLDVKYQQMGRAPILSVVDREGLVVWLMEYLRYSTNGCDHETASANTLIQILAKAAPPPVCRKPPCSYRQSDNPRPGGNGGEFTVIMFRIEGECNWKATSKSVFIHLLTEEGTFSSPLTFRVDANTGDPRRGIILVEWDGGSLELPVDQSGPGQSPTTAVQLFSQGSGPTSQCDIVAASHACTFKPSTTGAASYSWQAVYERGGVLRNFSGSGDTFTINEGCGGSGATPVGVVAEVVVTLVITDSGGGTVTIITGQGSEPQKFFKFFTCS